MRWIWIDRFTAFESGKAATAVKCLSAAEDQFGEHFPGFPVMPAPLILEGLAQTGGILVGEANQYCENVVLAKMSAKFHKEAMAGEQLTYTTTILDLQHEEHPEFFGRAELTYRKIVYGWTIHRSRIVITISEHARQTLIERHDVAPDRVRAIHLAVDHDVFSPGAGGASGAEPQSETP